MFCNYVNIFQQIDLKILIFYTILTLPRHTFLFNQIRHYGSMWPETNFDCSPFSHECTDRPVKILTYILDILKRYPMIKKILKIINMLNKIREKNFFFEKMMFFQSLDCHQRAMKPPLFELPERYKRSNWTNGSHWPAVSRKG